MSQSESHVWVHVQADTYPFQDWQMTDLTRSMINLDVQGKERIYIYLYLFKIKNDMYPPAEEL